MNSPFNTGARSGKNPSEWAAFLRTLPSLFSPVMGVSLITTLALSAMASTHAETTPNPNSLKFTTDDGPFLQDGAAAYSSAEEARDDPLARRLFSISGVEDVFITPQFVTVSKAPSVDWSQVQSQIETILNEYLEAS